MTSTPNQPDPTPRNGSLDSIPDPLRGDLKRAYHSDDTITPPSRVDDAVFAAASAHFAKPAVRTEPKPGVLGWIGRRPFRSAGLGGALLAASVLVVVMIVQPNQPTPGDRSVALDAFMEPGTDDTSESTAEELFSSPAASAPTAARSAGDLAARDITLESELAEPLADLAPLRRDALRSQASVRGDVNGDGVITIADALLLARMTEAAGGTLDDPRFDLLGNGSVSRADADAIARLVVRLAPAPEDTNPEGAS